MESMQFFSSILLHQFILIVLVIVGEGGSFMRDCSDSCDMFSLLFFR